MGNFGIVLDNKFDELINKQKNNNIITIENLIDLKSCIRNAYYNDNNNDNKIIKFYLNEIDFKI